MKLRRLRLQMSAAPPVVAMMTSACTLRQVGPCSPAECLDHAAQPRATTTTLPPRSEALRRWQLPPDDPWAPFAKYTLLASLDESPRPAELPRFDALDDVQRARAAGERAGAAGLPPDTLWIVDMRGAASVAFGAALSQADATGSISLVPTFNNWPAADEMVPAEETLAALASASPAPPRERTGVTRPVFLLDAWRLAFRDDDPGDETYDNRYALSPSDLPDVAALRAHGVRRVVYVVDSLLNTRVEEDDLHGTFASWSSAGVGLSILDVDELARPDLVARWDELLAAHPLVVDPRATVTDDPAFYIRARGGFGGPHARGVVRVGRGRGGGHHGGHGGHGAGG